MSNFRVERKVYITMQTVKLTVVLLAFLVLFCNNVYAKSQKNSKVMVSYISEKAIKNPFSIAGKNFVEPKNEKNIFSFEDKYVTWSAVIRGAMGKYDFSNYEVQWYSPDGLLYTKTKVSTVFMDCQGIKSALVTDPQKMEALSGLWKVMATYKGTKIDEKYFFLAADSNITKTISPDDIATLEARINNTSDTNTFSDVTGDHTVRLSETEETTDRNVEELSEVEQKKELPSGTRQFALSELKKAYVNFIMDSGDNGGKIPDETQKKYLQILKEHLRKIGLEIVAKKRDAEIIFNWNFHNVINAIFFGWVSDNVVCNIRYADTNSVLALYYVLGTRSIKESVDMIVNKFKKAYQSPESQEKNCRRCM